MIRHLCKACASNFEVAFDVTKTSRQLAEGVCQECEKRKPISEYVISRKRGERG